jgi:hypothetical protein
MTVLFINALALNETQFPASALSSDSNSPLMVPNKSDACRHRQQGVDLPSI